MHSICVPLIAIALVGLIWAIPVPVAVSAPALSAMAMLYAALGIRP